MRDKTKVRANARRYGRKNRLRVYANSMRLLYGLDKAEYDRMVAEQGGVCAICGRRPEEARAKNKNLSVDHNHDTGRIRGLLCAPCNSALGLFGDSATRLLAAVAYLKQAGD